jgi:hypothetical protein
MKRWGQIALCLPLIFIARTPAKPIAQQFRSSPILWAQPGRVKRNFTVRDKPHTCLTRDLIEHAISSVPKLRFELSDVALRNFLFNADATGVVCNKYRSASANGWTFPPLTECRDAWSKLYGPTEWETDMIDWNKSKPVEPEVSQEEEPPVVEVAVVVRAFRRYK